MSNGGAIYASNFNHVIISDTSFSSCASGSDGSVFYFNSGITSVSSSSFTLIYSPSAIYLLGGTFTGSQITMTNSDTSNNEINSNYYGSGMYVSNMNYFSLSCSSFTSLNYSGYGGAIYISDTLILRTSYTTSPIYTLTSCTFISNSAYFGGALYIDYTKYTSIVSWTFESNSAVSSSSVSSSGSGGAIYYSSSGELCDLNFYIGKYSKCVFETGNTFISNSAVSGGAVYWNYNDPSNITETPTYSANTATANTATKYGNNYGSFAQRLITITESQYNNINSSRYCFMHSKWLFEHLDGNLKQCPDQQVFQFQTSKVAEQSVHSILH